MISSTQGLLRRKRSISLIIAAFFLSITSAFSQAYLEVPIKLDIERGNMDGVQVKVKKDGKDAFTQSGSSKMRLKLDFDKKYTLIFTKEGYITKTIEFDTHAPSDRIEDGFEPYTIGVKLFSQDNDKHTVVYNQAVGRIRFDAALDEFSFDTDYSKSVLSDLANNEEEKKPEPPKKDPPPAPQPANNSGNSSGGGGAPDNSAALKQQEEAKKKAEEARLAEEARKKEEARLAEEAQKKEADRKAEEERQALAQKAADDAKAKEAKRLAQEQQVEAFKKAEAERLAAAERKAEEERQEALAREEADKQKKAAARKAEADRLAQARARAAEEAKQKAKASAGNDTNGKLKGTGSNDNGNLVAMADGGDVGSGLFGNSGSENQSGHLQASTGADSNSSAIDYASESITREDIVEDKKIITIVRVTKRNTTTEYRRVKYRWGGPFYFIDNKLPISETLFAHFTGVKD